jgi:hypothetical protein
MPKRSLHGANGTKQAQRLAAIGRRKLKLYRLAKGEPVIPSRVIKKLASLRLRSAMTKPRAASAMDDGSAAVDGYSGCRAVLTTARENF